MAEPTHSGEPARAESNHEAEAVAGRVVGLVAEQMDQDSAHGEATYGRLGRQSLMSAAKLQFSRAPYSTPGGNISSPAPVQLVEFGIKLDPTDNDDSEDISVIQHYDGLDPEEFARLSRGEITAEPESVELALRGESVDSMSEGERNQAMAVITNTLDDLDQSIAAGEFILLQERRL